MIGKSCARVLVAAGVTALALSEVAAQPFPSRPITIIVSFAAGGAVDLNMRMIARQIEKGEDAAAVAAAYADLLDEHGLPRSATLVGFPDFLLPGAHATVPAITEHCMTTYQSEHTRRAFMCAFSKMIVKKNGRLRVYACTLVDDDPDYDLGGTLAASLSKRIMLRHHRCYSCFAYGSSCSEIAR